MKVENLKIYDLDESLIASGYAMRTELVAREPDEKDVKRAMSLTKASNGNGAHGQFLTGVRVAFDLTCTNKMWVEAERYRFLEFVTSQSTMHRIAKFDLSKQFNEYVDPRSIEIVEELKNKYNENPTSENYLRLLYSVPSGFELTARLTTNYRCLLNIYVQRNDHRLPEWREFCEYIRRTLPYFDELLEAYYSKDEEMKELRKEIIELREENGRLRSEIAKYENEIDYDDLR